MRELIVKELEAGQRLDKFLHKYLKDAPNSFLYKMMRKKNIVDSVIPTSRNACR